jgi:hypothetical protein
MSTRDQAQRLLETMAHLESELQAAAEDTQRNTRRAVLLIYVLIVVMGGLALVNMYFVNDVTQEVGVLVRHLDDMLGHFERVSALMTEIRGTVSQMSRSIDMMPILGEQMAEMGDKVASMRADVERMKANVALMDTHVATMKGGVRDMSIDFRHLNRSVGVMGMDVHEFSKPVP